MEAIPAGLGDIRWLPGGRREPPGLKSWKGREKIAAVDEKLLEFWNWQKQDILLSYLLVYHGSILIRMK